MIFLHALIHYLCVQQTSSFIQKHHQTLIGLVVLFRLHWKVFFTISNSVEYVYAKVSESLHCSIRRVQGQCAGQSAGRHSLNHAKNSGCISRLQDTQKLIFQRMIFDSISTSNHILLLLPCRGQHAIYIY